MRWTSYKGYRIPTAGHRTFVELPALIRFAEPRRRYGCVWTESDGRVRAYVEVLRPGQVEDVDLGPFSTTSEARRAVEAALRNGDEHESQG